MSKGDQYSTRQNSKKVLHGRKKNDKKSEKTNDRLGKIFAAYIIIKGEKFLIYNELKTEKKRTKPNRKIGKI